MKRYLVFAGNTRIGGIKDLIFQGNTELEALNALIDYSIENEGIKWYHVYDTVDKKIIKEKVEMV